ncbi:MAG: Crp/Fnr family transcriptional regulator [Firmicutes bacterium]|nr:Crp/Fnr family transcriptional regulator [Bacillota bacterium]
MDNILELSESVLFEGFCKDSFYSILNCISNKVVCYKKGGLIISQGQPVKSIGLLLSGGALAIKLDEGGNASIVLKLKQGDIFGDVLTSAQMNVAEVSIEATENNTRVLFLDYKSMVSPCANLCNMHNRLIINLLKVIAKKNYALNKKISILSKRSTKDKVLAYLKIEREKQIGLHAKEIKSPAKKSCYKKVDAKFIIPYSRQELADYLCVERSALSAVLSDMKREGLIAYKKNRFELLVQ